MSGGQYCRLHDTALLACSGADVGKFLQGQSTCDIVALPVGQSCLGAFCNAKGRVIAVFHAIRDDDNHYFLTVNKTLAERLRQHLSRYILRAQVTLGEVGADYALFGVIGDIGDIGDMIKADVTISPYPPALSLIMTRTERADAVLDLFAQQSLNLTDEAYWRKEILRHGLADIDARSSEAFIPQMLNLDLLNGISFKKGCYTGQEIVARTHYLGQCKRRLFRLKATADRRFAVGDTLYHPERQDDGIGTVVAVSDADDPTDQELLAVINLADVNNLPGGLALEILYANY